MGKSDIRCQAKKCMEVIAKYGDAHHRVMDMSVHKPPAFMPNAIALCEGCGGYTDGTEWKYRCVMCSKDVPPGELVGFFVPHRCKECDTKVVAQEKASGKICSRCRQVYSYCCC